jgi:apolipoprotein N-acyltransferase
VRVVTPICFETTWGTHCRELVGAGGARRADVLVCLTNDGWFADSDHGREHHLQAARWRCLELATPMLRSANTGVSAAIDADGRVLARGVDGDGAGRRVDGVLSALVPLPTGTTFYLRHGDLFRWPAMAVGAMLVGFTLIASVRAARRRTATQET